MSTPEPTLGSVIKERRLKLGLTQAELARRVGCAEITVRKLEADALRPSVQMSELLALALGIPENEQLAFVQLARQERPLTPIPTPSPMREEIGQEDLSGRAIRGYELGRRINAGGFGVVYEAIQTTVERDVAVKIILPKYADHPDFIRRFEVEAQLVAQLEHPHIVPLYDYWREPGVAYLIMQLMRGGSLEDMLKEGALPPETLMPMLMQVGAALHTAHQAGIIHRDIKPANVLLDDYNNAYLADFGIAKNLGLDDHTQEGAIIGSPAYISPEQIKAEPIKAEADIYGLGIMVYELLTGSKPFQGPTPVAYIQQHLNESIPSLPDGLPVKTEIVLLKATAKNPADRYADIPAFLDALQKALFGKTAVSHTTIQLSTAELAKLENPYKGLRAFTEADAHNFFGRETLIQSLLTRMADNSDLSRFLAIVGPSGSGKSSVAKAGLVPALRRGGIPDSDKWFTVEMTPGSHPFEELEAALLRVAINPPESLLTQLRQDERGLLRASKRILPANPDIELLLLIDQFEELFTLTEDEAVRSAFLDSLVTAVLDPRSRLRLVITMRADFTDKPLQYVDFGDLMRQRTEFVLPLTTDELELVIVKPIAQQGMTLEARLAAQIIHDAGNEPGMLPLLQYALTELFDRHENGRLTKSAYEEHGGVLGALGHRGDDIYQQLTADERESARQLFLRLITLGEGVEDTRRRVRRSELLAMQTAVSLNDIIDRFGAHRLLTFDRDPITREPTVEIAHEALLREWGQLGGWVMDNRDDMGMERLLETAVNEWQEAGQDESYLLRGSRLVLFEGWMGETAVVLTANEQSFLNVSINSREEELAADEIRRQRELETAQQLAETERLRADEQAKSAQNLRKRAMALAGVLIIAVLFAIAAAIFAQQSQQNANVADEQRDNAVAAEATAEAEAVFRATAEAVAVEERAEAQRQASVLLASEAEDQLEAGFFDRAVLLALEAVQNYPYTPQAESALGRAVSYNRALGQYPGHETAVTSIDWSPDGTLVVSTSSDNTVQIWNPYTGETELTIPLPEGITGNLSDLGLAVRWSPDGKQLVVLTGDRYITGSQDYDLSVWDATTGEQISITEVANETEPEQSIDVATTFIHYTTDDALDFASQSGQLASIGGDNTALIWNMTLTQPILTLTGHEDNVNSIHWSPDETRLVTASIDGTARIWDAKTGEESSRFEAHEGQITIARWSPDGAYVITTGEDGQFCIWIVDSGELEHCVNGNAGPIWSAEWSFDGTHLNTGHEDAKIRVWDAFSGELIETLGGHDGIVIALDSSPTDHMLISGGGNSMARLWNTALSTAEHLLPYGVILDPGWSHDGQSIILSGGDVFDSTTPPVLAVWDKQQEHVITEYLADDFDYYWWEADYSPDDSLLLIRGSDAWPDIMPGLNAVHVIDADTGELVSSFPTGDSENWIRDTAWSPDGAMIAGVKINGEILVWDFVTGDLITTLMHGDGAFVNKIEWSPDGKKFASAGADSIAWVWDTITWKPLYALIGHEPPSEIGSVSWSPDSTRLLTTSGNDDLGATDTTVRIWDGETGDELLKIEAHSQAVFWGVWSPDGSRIATASHDDSTRIWDAVTGDELLHLDTLNAFAPYVVWSPDGQQILTSGYGQNTEIWRVWQSMGELTAYAKECCLFRELTPEERAQFGLSPASD